MHIQAAVVREKSGPFVLEEIEPVQNETQAPYGGMKNSGYGRFDGRALIDEFTELKWITVEPLKQQYPV